MNVQNELFGTENPLDQPVLRRYKIQKKLGKGGMGQVYLAIDTSNQRPVAIKSISISHKDDQSVQRLSREYRILQMIEHPNVVKGYEFFEENGQMFLAMEFIPGISLQDYIQTNQNPPLLEKLAMSNQLCRAVEVLNTAGILHRDLKPSNIMVNKASGQIKLLDMGLGKKLKPGKESLMLTQQGDIVGTPAYLSPEQVMGKVSEKTDVFALGIVLYQLFAWHKSSPFQADSILSTMLKISEKEIEDLSSQIQGKVPEEEILVYQKVSSLISQALVKDVDKRLSSAREMGDELELLYQELKRRHRSLAVGDPSGTTETHWKTSTRVSIQELDKLHALKKEQEKDSPRHDLNKIPRRNKKKSQIIRQSWQKSLIVLGIVCLLIVPIALSFGLAEKQESPRKVKKDEKAEKVEILEGKKFQYFAYGLPVNIWNECKYLYNDQWILDMTTKTWCALSVADQQKYASIYQKEYAREKKSNVEQTISRSGANFAMCLIPPGRFWMGGEEEKNRHPVVISKPFWMGKYEVTQLQWQKVMRNNPSYGQKSDNLPVSSISWIQCKEFCRRTGFKLPTEAEWEHACRSGTTTMFYWGEKVNRLMANTACYWVGRELKTIEEWGIEVEQNKGQKYGLKSTPGGSFPANPFGLYDMLGNILELCEDSYEEPRKDQTLEEQTDPLFISQTKTAKVARGGCWYAKCTNSSYRNPREMDAPFGLMGFRIAKPFEN